MLQHTYFKALTSKIKPSSLSAVLIIGTVLIFSWMGWHIYASYQGVEQTYGRSERVEVLHGLIFHLTLISIGFCIALLGLLLVLFKLGHERIMLRREIADRQRAEAANLDIQNAVKHRNHQLGEILATSNALRINLDADTLLHDLVAAAHRSLGFRVVVFNVLDEDAQQLRVRAHAGLDEAGQQALDGAVYAWQSFVELMQEPYRIGRCYFLPEGAVNWEHDFVGPVYHTREETLAVGGNGETSWQRSDMLFVPVELHNGEIVGIISVDQPHDGLRPTMPMIQALEIFSNQAAVALENARLYGRVQQELQERTEVAAALVVARDAAEAASRAKSAFLANMSHELRTPLNAILGYSQLIQQETQMGDSRSLMSDVQQIRNAGTQLLSLINSILDLAKIEAGKMEVYPETFVVPMLIAELVNLTNPLIASNGNQLTTTCAADIDTLYADRGKLRQVLLNLLSNAAKFTREGMITLHVSRSACSTQLQFVVADTGIGIAPKHLATIFDEFVQVPGIADQQSSGTGLGLAISRHFCLLMDGDIAVESVVGLGTTCTVRLPALPRAATGVYAGRAMYSQE